MSADIATAGSMTAMLATFAAVTVTFAAISGLAGYALIEHGIFGSKEFKD